MAEKPDGSRRHPAPHWRAKLTDDEVELVRELYAEGLWSYATLAVVFEVSRYTIRDIVKYRRR